MFEKRNKVFFLIASLLVITKVFTISANDACQQKQTTASKDKNKVQAAAVLTVSESKRLIAKAVAQAPAVQNALENGMVIITKGTTTTYVAEEILDTNVPHGPFVYGRVYPAKGGKRLDKKEPISEIVLVNGKYKKNLSIEQAVKKLKTGDVVIKGANALNYKDKLAAGMIGAPDAGTTGTIIPYITGRKAKLIIPVGLEKEIGGDIIEAVKKMQQPWESINDVYNMYLYTGDIITEIEALKILADVSATHIASGGIGGAQGSVRLLIRGSEKNVKKALNIIKQIQGEPPFVK